MASTTNVSQRAPLFTIALVAIVLLTAFQARISIPASVVPSALRSFHSSTSTSPASTSNLPDVVIFRRTRKTGSSSMLDQLLKSTAPHGYSPLYASGTRLRTLVRHGGTTAQTERILVAEHNAITRADVPDGRRVVIVDTFADGYRQMTSFCRYVRKVRVSDCASGMISCLRGDIAMHENTYRWAGRAAEDDDTYIDIPLSVAHVALSTRAFRAVFPGAVLAVERLNVANSSCPETPALRKVYSELYDSLDKQINTLRARLLTLTGYPTARANDSVSLGDMLDAAEVLEKEKLAVEGITFDEHEETRKVSRQHLDLKMSLMMWVAAPDGSLSLKSARA